MLSAYDFVFSTYTHIQPGLDTTEGCAIAFRKIFGVKADFAIRRGDHIVDALDQSRGGATSLYELYIRLEHIIGNSIGLHESSGILLEHAEERSIHLIDGLVCLTGENNRRMIMPHHLKSCVHSGTA